MRFKLSEVILAILLALLLPNMILRLAEQCVRIDVEQISSKSTVSVNSTVPVQPIHKPERVISVLHSNGSVVTQPLEDYIISVLLCEMPAYFESEALKAQSVVARTYALRLAENGGKHTKASVCTSPDCCQGYRSVDEYLSNGGNVDLLHKVKAAVDATAAMIITYNGDLVDATYFSCSGGRTEDALAVWGTDIPYLRSTESPGEESAEHFTDTVTLPLDRFCNILGLKDTGVISIGRVTYTTGAGVDEIEIGGTVFTGTQLRSLLELRSTAFAISIIGNTVTITTKGFGHRVGMSQYGAQAMALEGSNFEEILKHYYQGAELTFAEES